MKHNQPTMNMEMMTDTKPTAPAGKCSLGEIAERTKRFAAAQELLAGILHTLREQTRALERKHLPKVKCAVELAGRARAELHAAVAGSPELFAQPRTRVFHGVKVGLQKGRGGVVFADADAVVSLIHEQFGEAAVAYLRVKESPDVKMLAELPAPELARLGCRWEDAEDAVVIKSADSEVDKVASALLANA